MNFDLTESSKISSFYRENGFVGLSDVIPAELLQQIKNELERNMGDVQLGKASSFASNDLTLKCPTILNIFDNQDVISLLQELLGSSDIEVQHAKYNVKVGGGDIEYVPIHQDFPFFPHQNGHLLAFNIHIDGSYESNGCLRFLPGVSSVLGHGNTDSGFKEIPGLNKSDFVPFICQPGGISIHHCLTPHYSEAAKSGKLRRMPVIQLRNAMNKQVGGAIWKCSGFNLTRKSFDHVVQKFEGKTITSRRLWEPKEYFAAQDTNKENK